MDLRSARQRRGVSLEQIAETTKISIRFLRAIESEEYEKLPGGIFTTSYLRQYASAVGVEESRLLAYYEVKCQERDGGEVPGTEGRRTGLIGLLRQQTVAGR